MSFKKQVGRNDKVLNKKPQSLYSKGHNSKEVIQPLDPTLINQQSESAPYSLTPHKMLQLQRAVGNQVARWFAVNGPRTKETTAPSPVVRPVSSGLAHIIQRLADLEQSHQHIRNTGSPPENEMLDDFKRVQRILNDPITVNTHLSAISKNLNYFWPDLDGKLRAYETAYAASRPILIGAAGSAFLRVVNRTQMFNDLVAKPHGVYTHRLQWFLVGEDIKVNPGAWHNPAQVLYRAASLQDWRANADKKGAYMWELIVDQTNRTDPLDFTTPDNLEAYIIANEGAFPRLAGEIKNSSQTQRDLKTEYRAIYQESDHFRTKQDADDKSVSRDTEVKVGDKLFTGFLKNGWSLDSDPVLKHMYLPTVMYPQGQDPAARAG